MKLVRITDKNDVRLKESLAYYKNSFPTHEQRKKQSQDSIMDDAAYHFSIITSDHLEEDSCEIGAVLFWETETFIYVEHFYIYPQCRGRAYGSGVLELLSKREKTIILEIDPPVDEIAIRRKGFYERNGFCENPYSHVHPPYHKGNHGHDLVIMSHPAPISEEEYMDFDIYLKDHVMAGVF